MRIAQDLECGPVDVDEVEHHGDREEPIATELCHCGRVKGADVSTRRGQEA